MFRFGILWRLLLAVVLIAILVGGGTALYRLAWTQGYQTGVLAAGAANKSITPPVPYYGMYPYAPIWPGYGFPFFFNPFGLLIGIGFFLFFILLIRGLFFHAWGRRNWRGYPGEGYGPYGHHGPWGWREHREDQDAGPHGSGGFPA
jgi:hypothetical protein